MSDARRREPLQDNARLAREAFEQAQAETAAGNRAGALRWLDRACRLAPRDQTLSLALATACLGVDDTRATSLFAAITAASDVREAWFGLATAKRRVGDAAGAAAALAEAFARHVPHAWSRGVCRCHRREAGTPGWCSLSGDGSMDIHPDPADRRVDLRLDDRRLPRTIREVAARLAVRQESGGDHHG